MDGLQDGRAGDAGGSDGAIAARVAGDACACPAARPLITTVRERCRVCYTCVRECPAKAIRIRGGQAEVMAERCIGCGNCVRVCSQGAKQVLSSIEQTGGLLASGRRVVACLAPSFPAEFPDWPWDRLVGALRRLGFDRVVEVAFGADLVAERYGRLVSGARGRQFIASTCPAVVEYVERYAPHMADALVPIVSPMVATARFVRRRHGEEVAAVFVGPCIAKKAEAARGEVDSALTFVELRRMLADAGLTPDGVDASDFDPPRARYGALFSLSGGLLQTAGIQADLLRGDGVVVDGRSTFVEAIREFEAGAISAGMLEVLACNGCIMGPAVGNRVPLFTRRALVSRWVRDRLGGFDLPRWEAEMDSFADLDLARAFRPDDQRLPGPSGEELQAILARMGKHAPADELNCGACGYDTCCEHAIAIHQGLAESEMCLPFTIDQLRRAVDNLDLSHRQLADTQEALMQAEKLASMGQLAAGIAHEVNNPLGVVLMYAHLLLEESGTGSPIAGDLKMIAEQADRCKRIVAGLLNFARENQVSLQPVDVGDLVDRSVRALPAPANVTVSVDTSSADPIGELDRDQMTQVLTNLIGNAYDAMPGGGKLTVRSQGDAEHVVFVVQDTGAGIPVANMSRIFTPFFTTKPMGRGTGLGLAVTYGIVKMHRGDIRVESNADPARGATGTTFTVSVPRHGCAA